MWMLFAALHQVLVSARVRDVLLYFCGHEDQDIKLKALNGIGFLCNRYADFQLTQEIKDLYYSILEAEEPSIPLLTMVWKIGPVEKEVDNWNQDREGGGDSGERKLLSFV